MVKEVQKNLENYLKLYNIDRVIEDDYDKKQYDIRMTRKEKKFADSQHDFKRNQFTQKFILICVNLIVILLFLLSRGENPISRFNIIAYCYIFILLYIALLHNVNVKFYYVYLISFIIVFLITKQYNFLDDYELEGSANNVKK
jgi:hypothetical protein